jgi:hypothetical protein
MRTLLTARRSYSARWKVQQPIKFELVINLRTAKALGWNIPPAFPLRADQIID